MEVRFVAKAKNLYKGERIFYNCKFDPARSKYNALFLIIPSHPWLYII
jgi:hypothetical protein